MKTGKNLFKKNIFNFLITTDQFSTNQQNRSEPIFPIFVKTNRLVGSFINPASGSPPSRAKEGTTNQRVIASGGDEGVLSLAQLEE
jgi:hypothetical protein